MTALALTIAERNIHRAQAHHLKPVVMIGSDGLTPAVTKETDAALKIHGLIKLRVLGDDRAEREATYQQLCDELGAAPIQHIGKLLVLWRPPVEKAEKAGARDLSPEERQDRMRGPKEVKVLKYSSRGGQRPEVKRMTVLGNQRLTTGGIVKTAKPKQQSIKKRSQGR